MRAGHTTNLRIIFNIGTIGPFFCLTDSEAQTVPSPSENFEGLKITICAALHLRCQRRFAHRLVLR